MRSTQEWERKSVFPPPHFSSDYKTVEGMTPSRPPTCKPHKHPILMCHFSSTTLLSLNSLHRDLKDYGNEGLWSTPEMTLKDFTLGDYSLWVREMNDRVL